MFYTLRTTHTMSCDEEYCSENAADVHNDLRYLVQGPIEASAAVFVWTLPYAAVKARTRKARPVLCGGARQRASLPRLFPTGGR
jgi:hypothetical protein